MKRTPLLLLAPVALLLAACGGDDGDDASSAAPIVVESAMAESAPADGATASATDEELALEFAECLRGQGIDVQDPQVAADGSIDLLSMFDGIDPDDVSDVQQAAGEECAERLEGTNLLPDGGQLAANEEALLEFAQCLRDEGIDVEDPDVNAIGGGGAGAGGPQALFGPAFDLGDPAVEAAVGVCAPIMAESGLGPGA